MDAPEAVCDEFSDDELTRLALAADPDAPLPDDAVSVWELLGENSDELLPAWYMPGPARPIVHGRRWKRAVVIVLLVSFVAIDAFGLCTTYGPQL